MNSYKLAQSLELKKLWIECHGEKPETPEALEWIDAMTADTEVIVVGNVNTFLYRGRVLIDNLPCGGTHHWESSLYKVHSAKTHPYVKIAGEKKYLDEMTRDGDIKVLLFATTITEERKAFCIGLQTQFTLV